MMVSAFLLLCSLVVEPRVNAFSSSVKPPPAAQSGKSTDDDDSSRSKSPIFKFYNMENGMCPYAARTWITLLELGIPFENVGVSPMKKEEW